MMTEEEYHLHRQATERAAAGHAVNNAARSVHLALAEWHGDFACSIRDGHLPAASDEDDYRVSGGTAQPSARS